MTKVKIGINFIQDTSYNELVSWWQEAESMGYSWMGIPDSPLLVHGHYVTLTSFALNTKNMPFASMVTNPVTRHPSTVAGEFFSLLEIAPGRVSLGIGTGDSAAYGAGLKGSTVEYLRKYIRTLRGLLKGDEVEWEGATFKPEWKHWIPPRDIRIYVAAAGPKMLRMAAEEGDGVIPAQYPFTREGVDYVNSILKEGCDAVGKKFADLDIWYHPTVHLGESRKEVRNSMSVSAAWLARFTTEGKMIPDEYKDAVRKVADTWNLAGHGGRGNNASTEMAKRLGIFEFLVDRMGPLMGSVDEIGQGMKELSDLGINQVMLLPMGPKKIEVARALSPILKTFS